MPIRTGQWEAGPAPNALVTRGRLKRMVWKAQEGLLVQEQT